MSEACIRTEDINPEELKNYFVETQIDKDIINVLEGTQPVLLIGSRGTGKTMLLRMAEQELFKKFEETRVLPVFVNLATCNMYEGKSILQILISRTLIALRQSLKKKGIILSGSIFKPITDIVANPVVTKLETYINEINNAKEESKGIEINDESIKMDTARLQEFLNELCQEYKIKRIVFYFDEACQVFQPTQQRIFFDFFRSLRAYNIVCKAAVYPGIVAYGTFQKFHDATIKKIERSIMATDYVSHMREIVKNHFPNDYDVFTKSGEWLDAVIYASSGNPRFLLKSINQIMSNGKKFNTQNLNSIIKEFYGTTIWSEHVKLGEMYSGHKNMINWARNFIEDIVLEDILKINSSVDSKKTIYFCVSRNAPEVVKQAIKTLEYSGIVSLHTEGTKYRNEMFDRYEINLGIVVLSEKQVNIQKRISEIANNLSIKVFPDYGRNSTSYGDYSNLVDISQYEANSKEILSKIIMQDISSLELSGSIKNRLKAHGLNIIGEILEKNEEALQEIRYIGPVRSRKISNVVYNAILEYISG